MVVAIGVSIAVRDRVRRLSCAASGEDAELASLLAALAERFGFAELTREPRGGRGMRSWRHAPADLIERSGGVSGREALALSTIGRLVYRDGRLFRRRLLEPSRNRLCRVSRRRAPHQPGRWRRRPCGCVSSSTHRRRREKLNDGSVMRRARPAAKFVPFYLGLMSDPRNGSNRLYRNAPENVKRSSRVTID